MKSIFSKLKPYIFLFLVAFSFCCCISSCKKDNGSHSDKTKNTILIAFVDTYSTSNISNYLEDLYNDYMKPSIKKYLSQNLEDPHYLLTLYIYPLDGNTEFAEPLAYLTINEKGASEINELRDALDKKLNSLGDQLAQNATSYENPYSQIRILPSIKIFIEKFYQYSEEKQDLAKHVIYFSDMVELNYPSNPTKGIFSFLEKGIEKVDIHEVNIAKNQLNDPHSYINKEILEQIKGNNTNGIKIKIYSPGNLHPTANNDGGGYETIKVFWKNLFKKLQIEAQFGSIKECSGLSL